MDKTYYFIRLNPRRADFVQTMTDEERGIMQRHAAYWRGHMAKGKVVVFGPVFDPRGAFGMGVVQVDNLKELEDWIADDPAVVVNDYEYHPMRAVLPE